MYAKFTDLTKGEIWQSAVFTWYKTTVNPEQISEDGTKIYGYKEGKLNLDGGYTTRYVDSIKHPSSDNWIYSINGVPVSLVDESAQSTYDFEAISEAVEYFPSEE